MVTLVRKALGSIILYRPVTDLGDVGVTVDCKCQDYNSISINIKRDLILFAKLKIQIEFLDRGS